jgi:hypothetical protein
VAARGTEQDVGSAYNSLFTMQKQTGRRTSLIGDPPDGKIPPYTEALNKRRKEMIDFELALIRRPKPARTNYAGAQAGPRAAVTAGIGDAFALLVERSASRRLGFRCD